MQWAVSATGGFTKRRDSKGAVRKMAFRLANEEEVDPASFEKILDYVYVSADSFTKGFERHWLDRDMWRDALNAYQYLTTRIITVGRPKTIVGQIFFAEVLSWFSRSLFRWCGNPDDVSEKYRDNVRWFIHPGDEGDTVAFKKSLWKLKEILTGKDGGWLSFSRSILRIEGREINDDTVRDQAKQLKTWMDGTRFPELMKIEDLCASLRNRSRSGDAEIDIGHDQLNIAADELSEGYYISTFLRSLALLASSFGISHDQLTHPHDWFIDLLKRDCQAFLDGAERVFDSVPSRFRMDLPYREEYVQNVIQGSIDSVGHITFGDYNDREMFKKINDIMPAASEGDTLFLLNDVAQIAEKSEYCDGHLFVDAIRCIDQWVNSVGNESERHRLQKQAHQKMHLHGMLRSSYQDSENRRRVKEVSFIDQILSSQHIDESHEKHLASVFAGLLKDRLISDAEIAEIKKWRKDRVDEWIKDKPYRRTRLMLAVGLGMKETAVKLLEDGADPCRISESYGTKLGDNGTALLFAIQKYKAEFLKSNFLKADEIWTILRYMRNRSNCLSECMNIPTRLKNYTCLGEAISSTDPEIVKWTIALGALIDQPTGGDEQTPVYHTLNELNLRVVRRVRGPAAFLDLATNRGDLNIQRVGPPAILFASDEEQLSGQMRGLFSDSLGGRILEREDSELIPVSPGDEERLLQILVILMENDADPDAIQQNGFTPLGFCREIAEIDNIGLKATEILIRNGAKLIRP